MGSCCSCFSSGSEGSSQDAEKSKMDAAYEKDGLIDFQFESVNRHLRKLFPKPTKKQVMKWVGFITATVNYFIAFGLDAWVVVSLFLNGPVDQAISYAVFTGTSIMLAIYEMKKAREIVLSDDICDAVRDTQSRRFYGCISYYHFLLWDEIDNQKTKKDRFFLFIYGTWCNGPRLLFVQTPQLVLCFMKMCKGGCKADPAIITKTIQLGLSLWALLVTLLIYPFLRLYFCCKYGPKFSFADYCILMKEQHVNKVLVPLLEKEDPSTLKALKQAQKEKANKKKDKDTEKEKEKETPQGKETPQEENWKTSIIEKAKWVIRSVYSLETLKEMASDAVKDQVQDVENQVQDKVKDAENQMQDAQSQMSSSQMSTETEMV